MTSDKARCYDRERRLSGNLREIAPVEQLLDLALEQ